MKNFKELSGLLKVLDESNSFSFHEYWVDDLSELLCNYYSKTKGDEVVVGFSAYFEGILESDDWMLLNVKYKGKYILKFDSVKSAVDFIKSFSKIDVGESLDDDYTDLVDEITTESFSGKSVKWDSSFYRKYPSSGSVSFLVDMSKVEWMYYVEHDIPWREYEKRGYIDDAIFSVHICRDDSGRGKRIFTKEELEYIKKQMGSKVKSFSY